MTLKIFHFLTSLGLALSMQAQERVHIEDPDLIFSYLLPKGWSNYDDDYYHYILNADSTVQVSLTYFDGMCEDLETCYTGELEGRLRSEYSGFKVLEEKTGVIAGVAARWAQFTGVRDGVEYFAIAYFLIWDEQFFKIVAYLPLDADEQLIAKVSFTVESLGLQVR